MLGFWDLTLAIALGLTIYAAIKVIADLAFSWLTR